VLQRRGEGVRIRVRLTIHFRYVACAICGVTGQEAVRVFGGSIAALSF
jgi:hypothetical protein